LFLLDWFVHHVYNLRAFRHIRNMPDRDALVELELKPKSDGSGLYNLLVITTDVSDDSLLNGIEVSVSNWVNSDQSVDITKTTGKGENTQDGRAWFEVPPIELSIEANPDGYEYASARISPNDLK